MSTLELKTLEEYLKTLTDKELDEITKAEYDEIEINIERLSD